MVSKYKNKPTLIDGIRFASKAEGKRYLELKLLERAGEITRLTLQTRHQLCAYAEKICVYVADFDYFEPSTGTWVTEDVKGMETQVFKIKAKLFKAHFRREIRIIK